MRSFSLVCVLTALSLGSYWCYIFSLDEDSSVITYKEFYETEDDIYPTASFCLGNPFSNELLSQYGVNKTTYLDFLRGSYFTKDMLNINNNCCNYRHSRLHKRISSILQKRNIRKV